MNRSSLIQPVLAIAVLMSLVVGAAVAFASPETAQAQDSAGISTTLQVSPIVEDQPFRTVAVALEPGQVGLAALGASLSYDANAVAVTSCSVSEVGACNVVTDESQVLVSVFNLAGLTANDQLLTVNFEALPGSSGQTSFDLVVKTAVTGSGEHLDGATGDSITVDLAAPTFGALTGTVMAADSETALFGIDVCVTHDVTQAETCTTTSGLGNWRIDDLATGTYAIAATDPTDVYAPLAGIGRVADAKTVTVDDLLMDYFIEDAAVDNDETESAPADLTPSIVPKDAVVVVYEASIIGQVTGLRSEAPVEAVQVCATQPFVLHQSCATTDADGQFALAGLSTGNYWIEVVDPLVRFEQARPKLVGVVSDEATRTGVDITVRSIDD